VIALEDRGEPAERVAQLTLVAELPATPVAHLTLCRRRRDDDRPGYIRRIYDRHRAGACNAILARPCDY